MKKRVLFSSMLLTLGVSLSVLLFSNLFTSNSNSIFAQSKQLGAKSNPIQADEFVTKLNNAYNKVAESTLQSVVNLEVEVSYETKIPEGMEEFYRFFGKPHSNGEQRRMGSGSGVIISDDGYIVTNNHVIKDAVDGGITVTTNDKKTFTAKLIGTDPLTDLALIKIDASNLAPAHFADVEDIKIGNIVVAVGSPLGLNATVTSGIISAISRGNIGIIGRDIEQKGGNAAIENFIQTDAPINPGNSGGGLFNINGSLVGINTAIASQTGSYIGYGFAIPIDLVKSVISDLMEDGKVSRGYIGVQISSIDQKMAKALGLDEVSGVLVAKVMENSAGEKAGIEVGDVILKVDSKEVRTSGELQNQVGLRRAGDEIELTIWRDNKLIKKSVTLKGKDNEDISSSAVVGDEDAKTYNFDKLGFKVEKIPTSTKEKLGIENGVMVSEVTPYSEAQKSGLSRGVIITKADKKDISSPSELKSIIDKLKEGDAILMQVQYEEVSRLIALEVPKTQG